MKLANIIVNTVKSAPKVYVLLSFELTISIPSLVFFTSLLSLFNSSSSICNMTSPSFEYKYLSFMILLRYEGKKSLGGRCSYSIDFDL